MTVAFLMNSGCFNGSDTPPPDSSQIIGQAQLYTFSSDHKLFFADAHPFILAPTTSLRNALDSLGRHLAETYFSETYKKEPTDIHFEIVRIDEISTPTRALRIAVVNMIDTGKAAMKDFFQGSSGGQTTLCMLGATFMQPHLSPPLLDGLVLLYNGKILPELDHINLRGLLTPRLVEHVAKQAINGTKEKPVI